MSELLAAMPIPVVCVRCHKETFTYHTNWDKQGPICEDCWQVDAEQWSREQWEEERREQEQWDREQSRGECRD